MWNNYNYNKTGKRDADEQRKRANIWMNVNMTQSGGGPVRVLISEV